MFLLTRCRSKNWVQKNMSAKLGRVHELVLTTCQSNLWIFSFSLLWQWTRENWFYSILLTFRNLVLTIAALRVFLLLCESTTKNNKKHNCMKCDLLKQFRLLLKSVKPKQINQDLQKNLMSNRWPVWQRSKFKILMLPIMIALI